MSVCLWSGNVFATSLAGRRRQPKCEIYPAVYEHLGFVRTALPLVLDTTYIGFSRMRGVPRARILKLSL